MSTATKTKQRPRKSIGAFRGKVTKAEIAEAKAILAAAGLAEYKANLAIAPLPPGAIKLRSRHYAMDALAAPDIGPDSE